MPAVHYYSFDSLVVIKLTIFSLNWCRLTAGERVARTNKQRMLVVTTLAPPNGRREGRKDEDTKNARCHNFSPTYSRRNGHKEK